MSAPVKNPYITAPFSQLRDYPDPPPPEHTKKDIHGGTDYINKDYQDPTNPIYKIVYPDLIGDGASVYSIAKGKVKQTFNVYNHAQRMVTTESSVGFGIIIEHDIDGETITALYWHIAKKLVNEGDFVTEGQKIGEYGDVGHSNGAHLHLELHDKNGSKVDPEGPRLKQLLSRPAPTISPPLIPNEEGKLKYIAVDGLTITKTPSGAWTVGTPTYTVLKAGQTTIKDKKIFIKQISWTMAGCSLSGYTFVSGSGLMVSSAWLVFCDGNPVMLGGDNTVCNGLFNPTPPNPAPPVICSCEFKITDPNQEEVEGQ